MYGVNCFFSAFRSAETDLENDTLKTVLYWISGRGFGIFQYLQKSPERPEIFENPAIPSRPWSPEQMKNPLKY